MDDIIDITDETYIGVHHIIQLPLKMGVKITTMLDEIIISSKTASVIDIIDENSPINISNLRELLINNKILSNKREVANVINELIEYKIIEILYDTW